MPKLVIDHAVLQFSLSMLTRLLNKLSRTLPCSLNYELLLIYIIDNLCIYVIIQVCDKTTTVYGKTFAVFAVF